jgi:uncharacterized protein HemX
MSETKAKAGDSDALLSELDDLHELAERHTTILTALEARPIIELTGMERRLEELADAVERLQQTLHRPRRRWWITPMLITLALLVGLGSGSAGILWLQHQHALSMGTAKTLPTPSTQTVPKKGK